MAQTDLTLNVTVADWPPIKALIEACVAWHQMIEWWPDNPPKVMLPAEQVLYAAIEALPKRMEDDVTATRVRAENRPLCPASHCEQPITHWIGGPANGQRSGLCDLHYSHFVATGSVQF